MKKKLVILTLLLPLLFGCGAQQENTSSVSSINESSISTSEVLTSSNETNTSSTSSSSASSSSSRSSSSRSSTSQTPISVNSVSLNKSSFVIYVGDDPVTLTASISPSNATNKNMSWYSSNEYVALVSSKGKVTAISEGTATIIVVTEDGEKTASCSVTVKEYPNVPNYVIYGKFRDSNAYSTKSMLINSYKTSEYLLKEVTLYAGDIFAIHMYGNDWYDYSALKNSVPGGLVTKGDDNYIKVTTSGLYDIYCDYYTSDGGHIYLDKVGNIQTVPVSRVEMNRSGLYMVIGETFNLYANVLPGNASVKGVTFSSENESIAKVDPNTGVVKAISKGKTYIYATSKEGNKKCKCMVFVDDSDVPMYYLYGTIGGEYINIGNYEYACIPDKGGLFIVPDVQVLPDDEIFIYNSGAKATIRINDTQFYSLKITERAYVDIYFDVLNPVKRFLTLSDKYTRVLYINYADYTNSKDLCAWIYVQGENITNKWIMTSDTSIGSTRGVFVVPRYTESFIFVRGYRTANPDSTYESIGTTYKEKGPIELIEDVNEYTII